jgi:uncharacterized Zn-finger protein
MTTKTNVKIPTVYLEMNEDNYDNYSNNGYVEIDCPFCDAPNKIEVDYEGHKSCSECNLVFNVEGF